MAFSTAGAAHVALIGRTEKTLQETAALISSAGKTSSLVHVADITKADSLASAATAVGKWHILVVCSGYCPTPATLALSEDIEWWSGFQVRVCLFCLFSLDLSLRHLNRVEKLTQSPYSTDECSGNIFDNQSIPTDRGSLPSQHPRINLRCLTYARQLLAWTFFLRLIQACTSENIRVLSSREPKHICRNCSSWYG